MSSVLFFGKREHAQCSRALEFCNQHFDEVWSRFTKTPPGDDLLWWQGDYIISFLYHWPVPEALLKRASKGAFNFHPGPPSYPGTGCVNFALYNNDRMYGCTCHLMEATPDTGQIVATHKFPMFKNDTVASLLERTYAEMLVQFYGVMAGILDGRITKDNSDTSLVWEAKPTTRKQLDALYHVPVNATEEEVKRRIRACSYGTWQPYIELAGRKWELTPDSV
jgi:methionyl-tRNA formyltransferase